jgi:enoyl-[acyl-carrier protein] reductase III
MVLAGKIALVTGGSRGIGRAIALKLADMGADIAINFFRSRQKAQQTQQEIFALGRDCAIFRANINDVDSIKKLFHDVKSQYGRIDILIANAAMAMFGDIEHFSLKGWEVTMDANAKAYFLCAQEAVRMMPRGGKIVALTSYGSQKYIPGYAALGSAKAAIETLTKYLAVEFAHKDINVNCVSGGAVDTDSFRILSEYNKHIAEECIRKTPAKRLGQPEDIANVVAFLCTPEAEWIRGQTIIADGGFSLM